MTFCATCGAQALGNFCATCGSVVGSTTAPAAPAGMVATADVITLAKIQAEAAQKSQRHGIPALLSVFIPGLGQLIKGQFLRGVIYFVGAAVSVLLIAVGIGLILTPILWIWQIYDAYTSPE